MLKLKLRHFLLLSLANLLVCSGVWSAETPTKTDFSAEYLRGNEQQKAEILAKLSTLGDAGLPVLQQIGEQVVSRKCREVLTLAKRQEEYGRVLDAIARIGTDPAADYLQAQAVSHSDDAMRALARTGTKGLDRLLKLAEQTEAYREPRLALEFRERIFIPFPKKQQRPTLVASRARVALAFVSDPAAAPTLGKLLDRPEMRSAAFRALAEMKVSGFEQPALRIWQQETSPAALRYLLAVDRASYLPLLQKRLTALDDEVTRLVNNLADLRARNVRDFVGDDTVVRIVFELGGDEAANGTLVKYIESPLWLRNGAGERTVAFAVMALGRTKTPEAKQTLLRLLKDATPVDFMCYTGEVLPIDYSYSFLHYGMDGLGRGRTVPMFAIATTALQDMGDPSVIPQIEEAAALQVPRFKISQRESRVQCFFAVVLMDLRDKNPN